MKFQLLLLLIIPTFLFSQETALNKIIEEVKGQEDEIKATYEWITANIEYDKAQLKRIEKEVKKKPKTTSKTQERREQEMLRKTLGKKRGVCQDYALLFHTIAQRLGYDSHIVTGYVRKSSGNIAHDIGHAWNAIKVDGEWSLYDSTWGAGAESEDGKSAKERNAKWYKTPPSEMIKDHMPYDPIWQLLEKPISYEGFKDNNFVSDTELTYNLNDQIDEYLKQNEQEQATAEIARSKSVGAGIKLVKQWRKRREKLNEYREAKGATEMFNETGESMNQVFKRFNEYIKAKNKKFKYKDWSDEVAKDRLQEIKIESSEGIADFQNIETDSKRLKGLIKKNVREYEKFIKTVNSELEYLSQ